MEKKPRKKKAPDKPRCGKCKFWSERKRDPAKDVIDTYRCRNRKNQNTQPVGQWDGCATFFERRQLSHAKRGRPPNPKDPPWSKGVQFHNDAENKKLHIVVDYSVNRGLSSTRRSFIYANFHHHLPKVGNGWRMDLRVYRVLSEEEKAQLALMGEVVEKE